MKSRLFWKILLAFWLTFFCIVPAIWIPIATHTDGLTPQARIAVLAGKPVAPPDQHHPVIPRLERRQSLAEDVFHFFQNTWQAISVGVIVGVAFSIFLARYLAHPLNTLHEGFARLSAGDLTVRLSPVVGHRRDEIADLAKDFDAMTNRLQVLLATRDNLLHDVSHELRSPLSRLQLSVALLRKEQGDIPLYDRIDAECQKLDQLVRELLTLARAESGAQSQVNYFDPIEVVSSLVEDARFEAQSRHVAIELTQSERDGDARSLCKGNDELFARAIENILRNAVSFSPERGEIKVSVDTETADPGACEIIIADQGPGVSDEILSDMFHPFVRAGSKGYGLGLSIAQRAMAAQGGSVGAANADGGGLIIRVKLPVERFQDQTWA